MALAFDHLLLAVADLDAAAERLLAEHGLASLPGGRHDGHGTANRIVPLGSEYLELISVVDPTEAETSPVGRWIRRGLDAGGGLWGLNLRTDDAEALARHLGLEVHEFIREPPDGDPIRFRLVGLEGAVGPERLPFFSEHPEDAEGAVGAGHPGRQEAPHRVRPRGIRWVELGGDEESVRRWIGPGVEALDLRFVGGAPGLRRAAVSTDAGEVVFSGPRVNTEAEPAE